MRVLLDTSVLIAWERGSEDATQLLKRLVSDHDVAVSIITVIEYLVGANQKDRVQTAHRVLGQFRWEHIEPGVAHASASHIAHQLSKGTPNSFQDAVIEATAEYTNRLLVTLNEKHFRQAHSVKSCLALL